MVYHVKADVELREACRREIQEHVDRYLALGGAIEKVQQPNKSDNCDHKIWRPSYARGAEFGA
jgi:hypothetical protein